MIQRKIPRTMPSQGRRRSEGVSGYDMMNLYKHHAPCLVAVDSCQQQYDTKVN